MDDLPRFQKRQYDHVEEFARGVFSHAGSGEETALIDLVGFDDGHFRAYFRLDYFTLPTPDAEPSRSQWGSLKKKLKRHDRRVFVFKAHGVGACPQKASARCGWVDFGFFLHAPPKE